MEIVDSNLISKGQANISIELYDELKSQSIEFQKLKDDFSKLDRITVFEQEVEFLSGSILNKKILTNDESVIELAEKLKAANNELKTANKSSLWKRNKEKDVRIQLLEDQNQSKENKILNLEKTIEKFLGGKSKKPFWKRLFKVG